MTDQRPVSYLLVGYGWRAQFFLRPPQLFPERFRLTGAVVRDPAKGAQAEQRWGIPTWRTLDEAVAADRPDFVIVAVGWEAAPAITGRAVALGLPVLTETPPAPTLDTLHALWDEVGATGLVQVAEQYPLYPSHQARRAVVDSGLIGEVNEVEVSSTHMYHAMGIVRRLLGVGLEDARVTAIASTHPVADPLGVPGWTDDMTPQPRKTVRAFVEFDSGRVGTYDFTDNQWWNPLRVDRVAVRGSLGEIVDDRVTSLLGPRTVVTTRLERRQTGQELNLEGADLDHISHAGKVVFENRWKPGRLADDEIAVTELLDRVAAWVRDEGPAPYPLAQGSHDWALALAMDASIEAGGPVRLGAQPWA